MKTHSCKMTGFSKMSEDELVAFCKKLYDDGGFEALTYPSLKKIDGLYWVLHRKGLGQRHLIKKLGIENEFKKFRVEYFTRLVKGKVRKGWTWKRILNEVQYAIDQNGFLPPAAWFNEQGNQSLVQAVYNLGKCWKDLYAELGHSEKSNFVVSRNGMRWGVTTENGLYSTLRIF